MQLIPIQAIVEFECLWWKSQYCKPYIEVFRGKMNKNYRCRQFVIDNWNLENMGLFAKTVVWRNLDLVGILPAMNAMLLDLCWAKFILPGDYYLYSWHCLLISSLKSDIRINRYKIVHIVLHSRLPLFTQSQWWFMNASFHECYANTIVRGVVVFESGFIFNRSHNRSKKVE